MPKERPKYHRFPIDFESEKDRDDFKNYVHSVKTGTGIPIHKTAMEMMYLHKFINREKKKK